MQTRKGRNVSLRFQSLCEYSDPRISDLRQTRSSHYPKLPKKDLPGDLGLWCGVQYCHSKHRCRPRRRATSGVSGLSQKPPVNPLRARLAHQHHRRHHLVYPAGFGRNPELASHRKHQRPGRDLDKRENRAMGCVFKDLRQKAKSGGCVFPAHSVHPALSAFLGLQPGA